MGLLNSWQQLRRARPWMLELMCALLGLAFGVTLMPVLIFYAGAGVLGRYEGASPGQIYTSLFAGLREPAVTAWVVLVGPYGLFLIFRALLAWWRGSAKLA